MGINRPVPHKSGTYFNLSSCVSQRQLKVTAIVIIYKRNSLQVFLNFISSPSFCAIYYFSRMRARSQPSVTHVFFLELIKSIGAVQAMMWTNR